MRRLVSLCLVLCLSHTVFGEPETLPVKQMTVTPRVVGKPALRYRVLPDLRDKKPGDAFPLYRAVGKKLDNFQEKDRTLLEKWRKLPLNRLPKAEVRKFLGFYKDELAKIDRAARCEQCNWDIAERLRKQGLAAQLDEIQGLRNVARMLVVRARLELAEGRPHDALRTLQTGVAMGRHVGQAPTLICHLVGVALTTIMLEELEEYLQQPDAPNLYWSLTNVPRPFLSLRPALAGDRLMALGTFPGLVECASDLNAGPLPPEKVKKYVKILLGLAEEKGSVLARTGLALMIRSRHETAKRALIASGRPRQQVEKMPHIQVALLHAFLEYDKQMDETVKWSTFPYWKARPGLQEAEEKRRKARADFLSRPADAPVLPLAQLFVPAVSRVLFANARLERHFALLRTVEAIRLYAANHKGELPGTLSAIQKVPVPIDPITGKPFVYRIKGKQFTLQGVPPTGEEPTQSNSISYRITLRP